MQHKDGKGRTGPGGMRCPCCTKGKPSQHKRATVRSERMRTKKILRSLLP